MSKLLIVDGLLEGRKASEAAAEQLVAAGFAEDADTMRFREAREDVDRLKRLARDNWVITHSAGILAVTDEVAFDRLTVTNGPEPKGKLALIGRATVKTVNHAWDALTDEGHRLDHVRQMNGNTAELVLHPWANLKELGAISRFSTAEALSAIATSTTAQLDHISTRWDEFFPADEQVSLDLVMQGVHTTIQDGRHDEFYIAPVAMIGAHEEYGKAA